MGWLKKTKHFYLTVSVSLELGDGLASWFLLRVSQGGCRKDVCWPVQSTPGRKSQKLEKPL